MVEIIVTFPAYLHHRTVLLGFLTEGVSKDELMMAFKRSVSMADLAYAYHPITSFLYWIASSNVRNVRLSLTLYRHPLP